MADRGRDLKFSILSDISQFDTEKPAQGLEDLGDAAELARRQLDELEDRGGRSLEDLGDEARKTADRVDDAFDTIAKSSRTNLRQKLDDDTDKAKRSLKDVGAEAQDTGREMAASFSGSFDDITSGAQELAANAGSLFGPIGLAVGGALSAGLAIFIKKKEEMKEAVAEIVDALVEGGGRIEEESIVSKMRDFARDGTLDNIAKQAAAAGVSADLYARALAGDVDAMAKVEGQAASLRSKIAESTETNGRNLESVNGQARALAIVRGKLNEAGGAVDAARTQWELLDDATKAGITANVEVNAPTAQQLQAEHAAMQRELGRRVHVPVTIDASRAVRIAWGEADAYFRRNPITIRTKGPTGQRPVRDVP